jgi:hypothetical protein
METISSGQTFLLKRVFPIVRSSMTETLIARVDQLRNQAGKFK